MRRRGAGRATALVRSDHPSLRSYVAGGIGANFRRTAISGADPYTCGFFATLFRSHVLAPSQPVLHPLEERVHPILLDDPVELVLVVVYEARPLGDDVHDAPGLVLRGHAVVDGDRVFALVSLGAGFAVDHDRAVGVGRVLPEEVDLV